MPDEIKPAASTDVPESDPLSDVVEESLPVGPTEFVQLHCHTLFSVLDGIASPRQYYEKTVEYKWPALGITEHGNLASIPDAYFCAKEFGVKMLAGIELYFNDEHQKLVEFQQRGGKIGDLKRSENEDERDLSRRFVRNRHLTVICKNAVGWVNLLTIMKTAWEHGFYYRPRVWFDLLAKHHEGLMILSGCLNGPISFELRESMRWKKELESTGDKANLRRAEQCLRKAISWHKQFRHVFGDDYYVELQMPGIPEDPIVFHKLNELARATKNKTVLTNDSHYIERRDHEIQKVIMAVDQKTTVDDPELFHVNSDEQFFKNRAELRRTFLKGDYAKTCVLPDFEAACNSTLEVADKAEPFKMDSEPKLPVIPNAEEELRNRCRAALQRKGLTDKRYIDRLEMELDRIIEKGFATYFLITQDMTGSRCRPL